MLSSQNVLSPCSISSNGPPR